MDKGGDEVDVDGVDILRGGDGQLERRFKDARESVRVRKVQLEKLRA